MPEQDASKRTTYALTGMAVAALLVFFFYKSGAANISCNEETVQGLVNEITLPAIKDQLIYETLAETDISAAMRYRLFKAVGNTDEIDGFKEAESNADQILKKAAFSMSDFRTVAKDKELNKVECIAEVHYGGWHTETEYNAQLTDDGEKVYVEVTQFLE
jgi:hypothetical protein